MDEHALDLGMAGRDHNGARGYVIGQLGQSLDGRVALPSGESKYISGSQALDHVHRLRADAEAVIVGVGTVLADDPLLTVRRVPGRSPARVVIDPSGRLPPQALCLTDDGTRRLVVRRSDANNLNPLPSGVEVIALDPNARSGALEPGAILAALAARGLHRILVEGGPRTLSAFLDAGCLDCFHIVVSPVILGSGRPGLDLAPIAGLASALRPATRVEVFADGDVLFDCDLRRHAGDHVGDDPAGRPGDLETRHDDAESHVADPRADDPTRGALRSTG